MCLIINADTQNKSREKREEEMNKTKKAIFNAAIKVFSIEGYDSATVEEIASEAGVAKGTLYYNFQGKEEIFKFVIDEGMKLIKNEMLDAIKDIDDPLEKLKISAKVQLRYVYNNKEFFRVIMSQIWGDKNRHQEMRQEIRRLVNINSNRINDITKGKADKDVLEVLGCCFIGVLFSSALYEILYEDQYSENYIVDRFMEYVNFSIEKINKKV